ncbi:MAG: hypothetical protein JEZ14_18710 [Marinilabiliaceae bacterium]|nr:hypothetical protein [Marinilabiliaceae bacterium]
MNDLELVLENTDVIMTGMEVVMINTDVTMTYMEVIMIDTDVIMTDSDSIMGAGVGLMDVCVSIMKDSDDAMKECEIKKIDWEMGMPVLVTE